MRGCPGTRTHVGRCAAPGAPTIVPCAPWVSRRPSKSQVGGARTKRPRALRGSRAHFGARSPGSRPLCRPSRGRRLTSAAEPHPITPAKMLEWRPAGGGSVPQTRAPGPPRPGAREVGSGHLSRGLRAPAPLSGPPTGMRRARGVLDAPRHREPSPGGLRHLAPLTAPAPRP